MAGCLQTLYETRKIHELSLLDGLQMLIQAETDVRWNNRYTRLVKNANFRYIASLEQIDSGGQRGIDSGMLSTLAVENTSEMGSLSSGYSPTGSPGQYVKQKLSVAEWGDKTVNELADFIQKNNPELKGFNSAGLYRMIQFYETYAETKFVATVGDNYNHNTKTSEKPFWHS
ncbi:hypothetical protein FQR65_LT15902 [Abscondita terminalis]|nr:hypothetical protein FQR65_LT15902 [Abscondita terminalis]